MKKISGHVVSTKPMSFSKAAKLMSRFAAVDNGSRGAVSAYLQRTAGEFNYLVQFKSKHHRKMNNIEDDLDANRILKSEKDWVSNIEKNGDTKDVHLLTSPGEGKKKASESSLKGRKGSGGTVIKCLSSSLLGMGMNQEVVDLQEPSKKKKNQTKKLNRR